MAYHAMVIVNPASANGSTGRNWPDLRAALSRVLDRWDQAFTLAPGDATKIARKAALDGYEMIVSIGGDGTMNEVVTGLLVQDESGAYLPKLIRDDLVLATVRAGTGGDFARYLGLSGRLPGSVSHLSGDATRSCDLGLVSHTLHDGSAGQRAFLNISSFGLSGVVDDRVNRSTKILGGTASFLIGMFRALAAYRRVRVHVSVDGTPFLEDVPMVTVAVANGQYFGGGMRIAPDAEIDDGRFEVVAQLESGVREVLSIRDLYTGAAQQWASVRAASGRVIEARATAGDEVLIDIDGEQPGRLPARFEMIEGGIQLKICA